MDTEDIWSASAAWMADLWDNLVRGIVFIMPPYHRRLGASQMACHTQWGVTMQEAADSLTSVFGGQSNRALLTLMKTIESEISPERIDGIEPCGYDAL